MYEWRTNFLSGPLPSSCRFIGMALLMLSPQSIENMINVLKFRMLFHTFLVCSLLFMHLLLKILNRMANNVDFDQTAPALGLHCLHISFC